MAFTPFGTSYQALPANVPTTDYSSALFAAMNNGLIPRQDLIDQSQSNAVNEQQTKLASSLMDNINGKGPNLAANEFQQAQEKNIAAGASQIASQRGINPALAARQIMQNTAATNQAGAATAAQLALQQQLSAQGQLAGVLGTQRGQDITQAVDQTQAGLNTIGANTSRAGTIGALQNAQNTNTINNTLGTNAVNANIALGNTQVAGNLVGGALNAGAGILAAGLGASNSGSSSNPNAPAAGDAGVGNNPSFKPENNGNAYPNLGVDTKTGINANPSGSGGGPVPGSPSDFYDHAMGGKIPGKARVAGDSPKNDTVPAMLSPDEVVLPRTIAKDGDKAKAFVEALQNESAKKTNAGYGKVIMAQKNLADRMAQLEKLCYGGKVAA